MLRSTSAAVATPGCRLWPEKPAQPPSSSTRKIPRIIRFMRVKQLEGIVCSDLFALAGFRGKIVRELAPNSLTGIGVRGQRALARDVGPLNRVLGVQLEPALDLGVQIGPHAL